MASLPWFIGLLLGIVVGGLLGIVALALIKSNKATENLCPRCKNETEEEKQLKQNWEEQQKGYNN
jgi:gas vesicle protein